MKRSEQKTSDTWNLQALFASREVWEKKMDEASALVDGLGKRKGAIGKGSEELLACLKAIEETMTAVEDAGLWASLNYEADGSDPANQDMEGKAMSLYAKAGEAVSWFAPELMEIDSEELQKWMASPEYDNYRVYLEKTLRMKERTLSADCERILALNSEASMTASNTFHDLTNVDFDFGSLSDGSKLTHASFGVFLRGKDEKAREEAYRKYYAQYDSHRHAIARLYAGSIANDIFESRARGAKSSLDAALFPDKVDESVYRNLIDAVHEGFPVLHRYYATRAKLLGKDKLKHWDVYVPMVDGVESRTPYDKAVEMISEAVKPLGEEYRSTLVDGLTTSRWVDRYENEGKRSGAFSSGSYNSMPYILTNYKEETIDSAFTLIHEGGHSMHSWYSKRNNPYLQSDYTIFEAEVASTFNEELLFRHLLSERTDKKERAWFIASRLDDYIGTLFRQTMFAEFELLAHEHVEKGGVATSEWLRKTYRSLLEAYFGPSVEFEEESDLECLRIPHFYRAFYVYKYSTGICAAIHLAEKVLSGGEKEREEYLGFLKSGGSKYPVESLKAAGVDMSKKESVEAAVAWFSKLLDELEDCLR